MVYVVIVVYDIFSFPLNSNLIFKTFKQRWWIYIILPILSFSKHLNKREFPTPFEALILSTFLTLQTSVHIVRFPYAPNFCTHCKILQALQTKGEREPQSYSHLKALKQALASSSIVMFCKFSSLADCKAQTIKKSFCHSWICNLNFFCLYLGMKLYR